MAVIGHSPYVMTPLQLDAAGDPVGRQIPFAEIPSTWTNTVSVYGPVATAAEWAAAELGGTSLARITFWLKLEEALAFGAVILALDRLLRSDPEHAAARSPALVGEPAAAVGDRGQRPHRRARRGGRAAGSRRAAGAHLAGESGPRGDGRRRRSRRRGGPGRPADRRGGRHQGGVRAARPGGRLGLPQVAQALAAAAAGFGVAVLPAYLAAGTPAIKVLVTRSPGITWDTMYQLFWRPVLGYTQFSVSSVPPHLELIAYLLFAAVALLALAAPPGPDPRPAGRGPGPGAEPGLALRHRLPAALVRRDGHQPARAVLRVPAGLGGPDPPAGRRDRLRPGRAEPGRAALALRPRPVRRGMADAGRPPAGHRRVGLALRFGPLGLAFGVSGVRPGGSPNYCR